MFTIALTRHPHARKELFLGKTLRVVSRSGLNPTEAALIEFLPELPQSFNVPLFIGGRTGALAMAVWLRGMAAGGPLILHTFDAHTAATFSRNLAENNAPLWDPKQCVQVPGFEISTTLDIAAIGEDIAFWQMTRGDGTAEQHLFVLEQLVSDCGVKELVIAAEELNPTFLERFRKACTKVVLRKQAGVTLLRGSVTHPYPLAELPNHCATFEVSLRGHAPITLETWPGCFCHRRADMGGLALTEVVAEQVTFDKGDRIMDMGCGCGMDGILLATAFPEKALRIDYQDSNAVARDSTEANLRRYPHDARFIFSAEGEGTPSSYDLFLANPPYFGDWRIAEFFIQTAARLLKKGGLLAFVSKREAKPMELMSAAGFEHLGTFSRRGYTVLLAARR